ncbi:MAG: GTPase ObgE [bacterium]|nr:GTPase ObgE [bacterium]
MEPCAIRGATSTSIPPRTPRNGSWISLRRVVLRPSSLLFGATVFIDEAEIYVCGGNGGAGCVSFRRERFLPKGGPDGGIGGDGGSVILEAVDGVDTLLDFAGRHHWRADNGRPGMGKNMTGASSEDLRVLLPPGTLVYDRDTDLLLKDLAVVGDFVCVAQGGRGGRGNKSFASPTNQTPREAEPGEPGEERWLRLELKLIADIGLVGLPNAGKSTLLSRMSKARPKIAAYPFTTLEPQLGIVELPGHRRCVMADLPGLIEGAHRGEGLGDTFLRHIERTRVLLHLIDAAPVGTDTSPLEAYRTVRREIESYSSALAEKPEFVVLTKLDLVPDQDLCTTLAEELDCKVLGISAVTGAHLKELGQVLWGSIADIRQETMPEPARPAPDHQTDLT